MNSFFFKILAYELPFFLAAINEFGPEYLSNQIFFS